MTVLHGADSFLAVAVAALPLRYFDAVSERLYSIHFRNPRQLRRVSDATGPTVEGSNPVCGDHTKAGARVAAGVLRGRFLCRGCTTSIAEHHPDGKSLRDFRTSPKHATSRQKLFWKALGGLPSATFTARNWAPMLFQTTAKSGGGCATSPHRQRLCSACLRVIQIETQHSSFVRNSSLRGNVPRRTARDPVSSGAASNSSTSCSGNQGMAAAPRVDRKDDRFLPDCTIAAPNSSDQRSC